MVQGEETPGEHRARDVARAWILARAFASRQGRSRIHQRGRRCRLRPRELPQGDHGQLPRLSLRLQQHHAISARVLLVRRTHPHHPPPRPPRTVGDHGPTGQAQRSRRQAAPAAVPVRLRTARGGRGRHRRGRSVLDRLSVLGTRAGGVPRRRRRVHGRPGLQGNPRPFPRGGTRGRFAVLRVRFWVLLVQRLLSRQLLQVSQQQDSMSGDVRQRSSREGAGCAPGKDVRERLRRQRGREERGRRRDGGDGGGDHHHDEDHHLPVQPPGAVVCQVGDRQVRPVLQRSPALRRLREQRPRLAPLRPRVLREAAALQGVRRLSHHAGGILRNLAPNRIPDRGAHGCADGRSKCAGHDLSAVEGSVGLAQP
mmetsp:Transcript_45208/g.96175  ORF Transcript_45208/g.96175 Transcript_45208/m.96175 type:complete len:368 (+) Transcript_45208:1084-2187(+)